MGISKVEMGLVMVLNRDRLNLRCGDREKKDPCDMWYLKKDHFSDKIILLIEKRSQKSIFSQ